jgi:hypothetical protein
LSLKQLRQAFPYTALAPFPVLAPVARGIERVLGHFTVPDGFEFVEGGNHLPAVPGLDLMEP